MERQSIATRHSLLSRLQNWEDQDSWRDFFEIYWRLIYGMAIKSGLTESEAQEVVQEAIIEIATKIKNFKYDPKVGSFKGWLRQLTRWRIADQFRKRRNHVPLESVNRSANQTGTEEMMIPLPDELKTDFAWDREWKQNLADAAIEKLRRQLPARQYQIFDLHVLRKWPVARAVGARCGHVYVIKFRVIALLKKEIQRLEKEFV